MASTPGMLFVTFQPESGFPLAQFHDWYNNEHAPARLRLPSFENGFRFRRHSHSEPGWMVMYQVGDVSVLTNPPYTTLREPGVKTERETNTMKHVEIKRGIYRLLYTNQARDIPARESGATVLSAAAEVTAEHDTDFNKWWQEEHLPLLAKVPGWLRSRLYIVSSSDGQHSKEYLALHEYDTENGVGVPDFQAAVDAPFALGTKHSPLSWDLIYTYGPAPRELGALYDPSTVPFQSRDGRTLTWPVPGVTPSASYKESRFGEWWPYENPNWPAIRSYITTPDGLDITYQLEGSGDPNAPLIVLVNAIATNYEIWDAFVAKFLSSSANKHLRLLRYNARGSTADTGSQPMTLDVLTADLIALLDALNVQSAAAAVGVSLGGATVLNAGLKFSDRIPVFATCNVNAAALPDDSKAWAERVEVADREDAKAASGEAVIGEQLAELMTRHCFAEASYEAQSLVPEIAKVKEMVKTNPREGFRRATKALCEYDLRSLIGGAEAKSLFIVGAEDGDLPETMAEMARAYSGGAELVKVEGAGHLPVVEKPATMAEILGTFVNSLR